MSTISILERAAAALPGATEPMLRSEYHALEKDFCLKSRAWRMLIPGLDTTNKKLDLKAIVPPLPGVPLGAIGPIQNGERWILPSGFRLRVWAGGDSPLRYRNVPPSATLLEFWPEPNVELTDLIVEVYLTPYASGELPEELCFHYDEALLAGLKGRMMLLPKKPYSDDKAGRDAMTEYRMGVNMARHQANKSRTTAPEPWQYPGWG